MTRSLPKAFAVPFGALRYWSVRSFFSVQWRWPSHVLKPIGHVLRRRKQLIKRGDDRLGDLQLITIHFDGSIEYRDSAGDTFKGNLYTALPGDLIFSKIDLRHGAIGILPDGFERVAVSSEYPVYEVAKELADPQYVKLLVRTRVFRRLINSMIAGASGRKRIKPLQFQAIDVPIPDLEEQKAIVAEWKAAQAEISSFIAQADDQVQEMDRQVMERLAIPPVTHDTGPAKAFAVEWKDLDRWSFSYNDAVQRMPDFQAGKFKSVPVAALLKELRYGTSRKATSAKQGLPVLRMNNITADGRIDLTDLKYLKLGSKEEKGLLLEAGDLLINRTNSKELVGKTAVYRGSGEHVFASYIIRARVDEAAVLPEYLSLVLNSQVGRQQIDAMSRQIIGQANINIEEIRSILIPLPALDTQRAIVAEIDRKRASVDTLRAQASELRSAIIDWAEDRIIGVERTGARFSPTVLSETGSASRTAASPAD